LSTPAHVGTGLQQQLLLLPPGAAARPGFECSCARGHMLLLLLLLLEATVCVFHGQACLHVVVVVPGR